MDLTPISVCYAPEPWAIAFVIQEPPRLGLVSLSYRLPGFPSPMEAALLLDSSLSTSIPYHTSFISSSNACPFDFTCLPLPSFLYSLNDSMSVFQGR